MIIVTLMVGALMEFVIFLIHVISKTREIGILKAIGTKNSSIMAIYVSQGVMYGVVACVIGVILGYAVSLYFIQNPIFVPSSHVYIRPRITAFSFLFASSMTLLSAIAASLYPAYRAVKIEIAEAMRVG
jgi:ABC-type lipoprotein release transport system permease subunit